MIDEIYNQCAVLPLFEKRNHTDSYIEVVFLTKDTPQWAEMIAKSLGKEKKKEGEDPVTADLEVAANYGGIRANQTLFRRKFGYLTVVAMFWPWQDGLHTTLKLFEIKMPPQKKLC